MAEKRKAPARPRTPKRPTPKPKVAKPKPNLEKVAPSDVDLVTTKGTPGKGSGPGGHSWVIMTGGERAGVIYINFIDEPPVGKHASIQIFLNQKSQGRGVGRVAYRLASEASQYDEVYAHMRKANVASRRAAEEAGYIDVSPPGFTQLIMKWERKRQ
ncbi:MAG TPA: GNAT family protein [Allosphingosinicella sp.]|nr:GNAT family protein [Allosphingosinicella sp.]